MSRQQIPVVCYDKNHYIYPANLLVISRLAKLFMHRTIGVIYGLLLAQPFPVPPYFPDATISLWKVAPAYRKLYLTCMTHPPCSDGHFTVCP